VVPYSWQQGGPITLASDSATADLGDDDPGTTIERATARFLELATTWIAWDGRPHVSEDGDRIYTPHKAVRRYADHLTEVEAQLAGVPTRPDGWHASLVTVDVDWARFTEADLVEATERLTRLSTTLRLLAAGPTGWDRPRGDTWTLREVADHVGNARYAEQVGDLTPR